MHEQLVLLGSKLKLLRKKRKLTLQALAGRTGLTAGLLSKIENFRSVPSLPVIIKIAAALEIDLAELFEGVGVQARKNWLLIRQSEQRKVEREKSRGMSYSMILETGFNAINLQVMMVTVQPQAKRAMVTSDADEMIYLLSGQLDFQIGAETLSLSPGDLLFFDGALPHVPINKSAEPASMLAAYFLRDSKVT